MKTTVIFHSADFDGLFCREIARKFLPDAELIGWDFGGERIKMPIDGQVYILDLSPECLASSPEQPDGTRVFDPKRIVWIDHHATSIAKYPAEIPGYRIDGVAACRLAWQWFCNSRTNYGECKPEQFGPMDYISGLEKKHFADRMVEEPLAVRLAGEYDIWDKRDPRAELFQHGLRSRDLERDWPHLLGDNQAAADMLVEELLDAGKALQYAKTHENESIIKSAGFTIEFEGLKFLACNHARYNSFLFTAGLKPEHDACLGFAWRAGKWTISLYHAPGKEHHDLSLIASKHGGGGHKGACGWTTKTLPFEL